MVWTKQTHHTSSWDRSNYVFRIFSVALWAFMPLSLLIHSIGLDISQEQPTASIPSTKTGHSAFIWGMSIIIRVKTPLPPSTCAHTRSPRHIHAHTFANTQLLLRRLGVLETGYPWALGLGFLDQLGSAAYCNLIDMRNHFDFLKKMWRKYCSFTLWDHVVVYLIKVVSPKVGRSVWQWRTGALTVNVSSQLFIEVQLKSKW